MAQFSEDQWFNVIHCYKCSMAFGVPVEFDKERLKRRDSFWCPAGHQQHYIGETEEQKLRREVERKTQQVEAANARANAANQQRDAVSKAHRKMRLRVANGVCPCCNRTFQNLLSHMKTEHPDFATFKQLATLRQVFGMTQADVAGEAGVNASHVSQYERGRPTAGYAQRAIEGWLARYQMQEADGTAPA